MYTIKYYTIKQYTGEMKMDNLKRFIEVIDEMMTDKSIASFEALYPSGALYRRFVNETARPITKASPVEKGHIR
jgi:hypothetical protein